MRKEKERENRKPGQDKERQSPPRDIQQGERSHGGSRQEREQGKQPGRGGDSSRGQRGNR